MSDNFIIIKYINIYIYLSKGIKYSLIIGSLRSYIVILTIFYNTKLIQRLLIIGTIYI